MSRIYVLNNMDIFRKIYAFMAAALVLAACHGVDDSTSRPVLTVDDTEIDLAVETHAVFLGILFFFCS